jgi:hypothetical protein
MGSLRESWRTANRRRHSDASNETPSGLGGPQVLHGRRDLRFGFRFLANAAQFNEAQCGIVEITAANIMSTIVSIGRGLLSRLCSSLN